jgi:hypothetical protein
MTDQEIPSAGAILLAAYFAIDTSTLEKILKPFLSRFPAVTGAMLWNIVKLSREEGKSAAQIAAITELDLPTIMEAERCIDALETISNRKNIEPPKKNIGGIMMTSSHTEHTTSLHLQNELDIATALNEYDSILQFVENIIKQSDLPVQTVITLQKRIFQIRRQQSDPHPSVAIVGAFNSESSAFSNALPPTELEQTAWKLRRYQFLQNITEKLLHLIQQLFRDLQASLLAHQESYISREQAFQQEIIPDLASFTQKQHNACQRSVTIAIADAKKTLKMALNKSKDEVWSSIVSSLNRAESSKDFEYFSWWTVSAILYEENEKFCKLLDQITFSMQQTINNAAENNRKQFNDAYQKLLSIGYMNLSLMTVMDDPGEHIVFTDTPSDLAAMTDDIHQNDDRKTVDSASLEGMIETFIAPGIGTLSDTTLGSPLESGSFSLSIEKKRAVLRKNLEPEINQLFAQLQEQLDDALNSYEDTTCDSLDQQINAQVRRYKTRIEALNVLQKYEHQRLKQIMQAYLQQIKQYEAKLQQLLQNFAKRAE